MRSLGPMTIANLRSFLRDRGGMFWTLAFPVVFVSLFGSIFSGSSSDIHYTLGWVDQDGSPAAAQLQAAFGQLSVLTLKPADEAGGLDAMQKGEVSAVVVVPKGFGEAVAGAASQPSARPGGGGSPGASESASPGASESASPGASESASPGPGSHEALASLTLYIDPSQSTTSATIQQIVGQVVASVNQSITRAPTIVGVAAQPLQRQDIGSVAYIVPSILAMALMQLGLFGAIPLVEQREKLIFKRLSSTPLARPTLVGSNVLVRLMIAVVQAVLIVGIGAVLFNVAIVGSLALMAFLVILGALTFIAIGYVVASFARTEETASATTSVLQFPLMFLSGIFFPFAIMPPFMKFIGALLPLTYLGDALRQVMVNGTAFVPLPVDIAVLTGWLVVCLAISARFFRWQ
jgi:ABC-2 type transport system permease protein